MLMIVAYLALLAAALAVPAALAGGLYVTLEPGIGGWAALPALVVLQVGVAAEAVVMIRWLGAVFERIDPANAGFAV
jgi:hypothetical protein